MKLLPFKLSEQEKQAMKEAGKSRAFKSFQKEIVIYLILLALAFVFLWKHYNILMLFVVAMAIIIGVRYNQALKSSKATYSIGEKVEKEIKRQQEVTKKVALPIIFGMVGIFVLFMVGLIVYVIYLKPYLAPKPEVVFPPVGQEQKAQEEIPTDETAGWKTYRNEEYGFEVRYPDGWAVNQEWWGSAVKSPVFAFKSQKGDREIYVTIQTNMFEELWRGSYDIITEREVVIGGVVGSKIVGVFKPTNKQEIFALVKKGENLFHINFPAFYQDEEFLDQMLSTFRFLDPVRN